MKKLAILLLTVLIIGCGGSDSQKEKSTEPSSATILTAQEDQATQSIVIFRKGEEAPIVTQVARPDFRPYLHPIVAPDGKGLLTEYSPGHHKHQTGLYWGFTRVNGRDYFHHPEGDYWKKVSAKVIDAEGETVRWQTVYDMLDNAGEVVLTETQNWAMQEINGEYILDLEWSGTAQKDVTIGEYDYGGLFLRMPWKEGINGEVVNAARQKNERAEGQRAMWTDVGMQVEGRDNLAHIAIFDHPENKGFPQTWRVDGQLGIGPVRARMGDWTIGVDETEVIQHRIIAYTGELNDVELTEKWRSYTDGHQLYSTTSLWGLAQQEGRLAKFLEPQEAVDAMTVKDGYRVNVWASEPMITQPMAFCWDDRGRLWIAENRDYETRSTGFSNSGDSRILILEDTDHDGVADSRKVFLEGIPFPSAIAVGFGGIFLGAPPNLLFVPDRDGDDRADMDDIEVRLTGWGIRDRHETINSLHWGPDGWLYGLEGFATPSKIRKPTGKGKLYTHKEPFPADLLNAEGVDINGGVWRYHPVKDRFEVVAHGFSNPWGVDFDARGQMFISACVIPHLWHVILGGIYQRQGGQHFNPYVYQDIQTITNHRHRSAHGGARVYLSDAFPKEEYGRLFMANIHEHAVLSDILEPQGSGFIGHHGDDFLLANNAQWIGFSMELGPEGALYVLDWHDADICGKEVLQKETGRIFRMYPKESLAENWEGRYEDLSTFSDEKLVDLQLSKSSWHARRARVILQHRTTSRKLDQNAAKKLHEIRLNHQNPELRLRGLWTSHITNELSESDLITTLKEKDPYLRAWAIQLLTEDLAPSGQAIQSFGKMAQNDPSPVVRLYLAAALQRMETNDRWEIAAALLARKEDAEDHNIPLMAWFGMEPLVAENPQRAFALAGESNIPLISRHIARRAVDAGETEGLISWFASRRTIPAPMLEGMLHGVESYPDMEAPDNWSRIYPKLKSQENLSELALNIAQRFGDSQAAKEYLTTLKSLNAGSEARKKALIGLAQQKRRELIPEIPALLNDEAVRLEAIRAVGAFNERTLGELLLIEYPGFSAAEKAEVIQAMSSRSVYGRLLTDAIKNGQIPRREIPAYTARQLRRVVGNGFVEVWGPIDQLTGDKSALYQKYTALLTPEAIQSADIARGKKLFSQTCGACHQMYGEGGQIGPDITGSNRTNLEYLLSNILDPSGDIQDDYKMEIVTTRDGRTWSGNIAAENDRQLTLRVVGQDAVVINKSDIQTRETSQASLMPEGLLSTFSDKEVIDLIGYLQTATEISSR